MEVDDAALIKSRPLTTSIQTGIVTYDRDLVEARRFRTRGLVQVMELVMDRRTFVSTVALGSVATVIAAPSSRGAPTATGPLPAAKNVVLVHGAYADGSCWADVIPFLQAQGLTVASVQNPLRTLEKDVEFAKRTLALMDGPTVLVGHS
jgi:hypothetical protein